MQVAQPGYSFETGEKGPGLNVLMGDIDPANAADYRANAKQFFDLYLQQTIPCAAPLDASASPAASISLHVT